MRSIAFILAIIILALSCVPCADGAYAMKTFKTKSELTKQPDKQNGQEQSDNCSPLCSCSCCAGFNCTMPLSLPGKVEFNKGKVNPFYLSSSLRKVALPVWQPPQLAA